MNIKEKITNSQMLLVGLGEELDLYRKIRKSPEYHAACEKVENTAIHSYLLAYFLENRLKENQEIYQNLVKILEHKNYFIVSLCQDGSIWDSELDLNRVVTPCGDLRRMQCEDGKHTELYPVKEIYPDLLVEMEALVKGEIPESELNLPVCPQCGKPLAFNHVETENYVEDGYLSQWSLYKKWLQGTLNRELCLLELGVGMAYPTVIRWPFEKTTYINNKAYMYRVHHSLYQITEEIAGKAEGICQNPADFLKELSKQY
mgnify:FL=1